jgi:hypothetical protein
MFVFALPVLLPTLFPMPQAKAAGTTYYISNCGTVGNDLNDGLSTSTPWPTRPFRSSRAPHIRRKKVQLLIFRDGVRVIARFDFWL